MTAATIMVVDDNASTRRMVKNALSRAGYHVVEASDGAAARTLMAAEKPRLVLQDLVLPDVDGFSLVGELRGIGGTDVSILAFSGFVNKLDEARISAVGFDHIIPKPIAPSALVPIIEAHLPLPATSTERFGAGRRIVVADDDPMQLKLASFRLARLGFEIETVSDGAAALAAVRRRKPDAVVSDVMMPELDGFGLAMALRQDPDLAALPLVLVTSSYIEPSDRELAKRSGANELVVRTPELTELIDLLRSTLSSGERAAPIDNAVVEELERERNRRVFRQLERQVMLNTGLAKRCSSLASELTVLTGIADTILKHRDIDVALDDALAACFDAGGVSVGALYQIDAGKLRVRTLGDPAAQLPSAEAARFFGYPEMLDEVMSSGEPLYIGRDGANDVGRALLAATSATALLVVPLVSPNGPVGALLMVARNRDLDEQDWRSFAIGVAAQLSQVITLSRAYANAEAAERKAAAHAALLEAVVQSAPDFVLHLDLDGVIRFLNRTRPNQNMRDLLGHSWFDFVVADQRANAKLAFETAIAGMTAEFETSVAEQEGAPPQFYSCRLGPVREGGKITGAVIVARDVTDKKQTEMQLMLADRMASVGTLAAGVAHEINNPLAAVIANLDMAIQDVGDLASNVTLPADLVDELQDARLSADRVREIVRDLKLFSRTHEEQFGAVNVEKVIDSTLRMAHNEIRHRAKLIKTYGNVPRVVANESRLGQVLLNLIVNAVQAIPEGNYDKNEIRVSTHVNGNGNNNVIISIRDTGGGMTPEVKQRLFTPFFTTKPIGVGTGLGLAISHRIINAMGGTIAFESEVGKGTEFRILLPIAGAHIQPITQKLPTLAAAVRRGRVLVIDDEETLGQAIRRYLAQDHDVEAVTSGRSALEILAGGSRFDVILCDLMMPQMTGMELHATLVKLDPVQAQRMVFVTGGAFTETARAFFEETNNPRIEKPFDLKTLRHLINELIR